MPDPAGSSSRTPQSSSTARRWERSCVRALSAFVEPLRLHGGSESPRGRCSSAEAGSSGGVPILCEIGGRDIASGAVSFSRRDRLRKGEKIDTRDSVSRRVRYARWLCCSRGIQASLHREASERLHANIRTDIDVSPICKTTFQTGESEFRRLGQHSPGGNLG